MPFPRSQLDIIIVSSSKSGVIPFEKLHMLQAKWERLGITNQNRVTPYGLEYLGLRNVDLIRIEHPEKHRLYANHQGGYRVYCPECNALCTSEFVASIVRWRRGDSSPDLVHVACPDCTQTSSLSKMVGRPNFAFAKGVVILGGVNSTEINPDAIVDIQEELGPITFVYRRVG